MGLVRSSRPHWSHVIVAACLVFGAAALAGPAETGSAAVATPAISTGPDLVVGEADGVIEMPVTLSDAGTSTVTVAYAVLQRSGASGTACNADFVEQSGTLTFTPGDTMEVVSVEVLDCPDVEGFETFELLLFDIANATWARWTTRVGIVDNDTVVDAPTIVVRGAVVDETDGHARVSVLLGGVRGESSASPVSVNYQTANGSATGGDYTATSGALTFTAGETAKTVLVPIVDDATAELGESFTLGLSGATGGAIVLDGTGSVAIGPSDDVPVSTPRPSLTADVLVGEGDGMAELVVSLSSPGTGTAAFVVGGSALTAGPGSSDLTCAADKDFGVFSDLVTFEPGETTKVVPVPLLDCPAVEGLESFRAVLEPTMNDGLPPLDWSRVGIVDNDTVVGTPALMVRDAVVDEKDGVALASVLLGGTAGQASTSPVSVGFQAASESATAGSDFTAVSGTLLFAPGETAKTVSIPILDDGATEALERFNLGLSSAVGATILDGTGSVTIGASDAPAIPAPLLSAPPDSVVGEADGFVDLVLSLSAPSIDPITVSPHVGGIGAIGGLVCDDDLVVGIDPVTFTPGQTTKVIRVDVLDCPNVEGLESFALSLGSQPVEVARELGRIGIVDNDTVAPTPRLFVRDVVVDEKDGFARVVVLLGGTTGAALSTSVPVDFATSNASATAGSDYTSVSGTLIFAPRETVKTVLVPIVDDGSDESGETFVFGLSGASGATIADGTASVAIGPSDAAPLDFPGVLAPPDLIVGEGDGYLDLVVRLEAPSVDPVAFEYSVADGSATGAPGCGDAELAAGPRPASFLPGETIKTLRIDIVDCPAPDIEQLESFLFFLEADPDLVFLARDVTQIGIVDNDTVVPTPKLVIRDAILDEKDGTARVPVLLGGVRGQASTSPVTVQFTTSSGSATSGDDFAQTTGTLTFSPGETVKTALVAVHDDSSQELAESLTVVLSDPVGATIENAGGTVSIGPSDAAPVATPGLSVEDVTVSEAAGYVDVVVSLSEPSESFVGVVFSTFDVTATAGTNCNPDYVEVAGLLTFAPGETTKVVRVHVIDCSPAEGLESLEIELFLPANATLTKPIGVVTIEDDDGPHMIGLTIAPKNDTIYVGDSRQLTATAHYSNAPPSDLTSSVTWQSSHPSFVSISPGGLAQGLRAGTVTIWASVGSFVDEAVLTVQPLTLVSIAVTPVNPAIPLRGTVQFTATGTYSNGSSVDLTSTVSWITGNRVVASMNPGGLAYGNNVGTTTVTATYTVSGSTTLTVVGPPEQPSPPTPKPLRCKVPKVVGKPLAAAKLAIKRSRCRTGKVASAYSRRVKKGRVISQSRRAGRVMPVNSKVNLLVSRGPRPSR